MSKQTTVSRLPDCDLCANGTKAKYDVRLPRQGCWANVCEKHFKQEGCALGTGLGQELIEETDKMDIREAIKQLAKGQGSYGRLDARLDELQAEDPDKYDEVMQELDAQNFKDIVDLVMYLEG